MDLASSTPSLRQVKAPLPAPQLVGHACPIAAHQQMLAIPPRGLGDGIGEDLDVIGSSVQPRPTSAQFGGEELFGVVTPDPDRVIPESSLERRRGHLLLRVGDNDRGIHIQHDHLPKIGVSNLRGRNTTGGLKLRPDVAAGPRPCNLELLGLGGGDLVQSSPYRRGRGHRPQHLRLVPQHVDVGDGLTTVGEHQRKVSHDLPTVMNRDKRAPHHGLRQLFHQPGPFRHHA